jgi:predicted AAA+ superfamily ATPase
MFNRILKMALPDKKSAFLWGARQTGKSTYLKNHFPLSIRYDLLKSDVHLRLEKNPHFLREEVSALNEEQLSQPIIIDEIQKVPALLDEVHWLIENRGAQFILCGSSARKLKRLGTNLLGGRALRYHFYPLTYAEIPHFDLLRALDHGLIPSHYLSDHVDLLLESYVADYLNHEIREEGLVRNLPQFARFLDSVSFSNGQLVNYTNISRDCGVSAKTVESYYQILIDTLLGYFIPPFHKKVKRDLISKTPKFYLFDVGVVNYLTKQSIEDLRGSLAGAAFEHFILMELLAYKGLMKKRYDITYWRTKTGLEVDFILDQEIAIEVKISQTVHKQELKGLIAFCEEHHPKKAIVVSLDPRPRLLKINEQVAISILPWEHFLKNLWAGEVV